MKCLTLNEMLDLIDLDGDKDICNAFAERANKLADEVAAYIAAKHKVKCTKASTDAAAFGGTAVNFGPINAGDQEPVAFKGFDVNQPWEE